MFDAVNMLPSSWDAISIKTIVKCFRKSEIISSSRKFPQADGDNLFKQLKNKLLHLRNVVKARFETKQKHR